MKDAASFQRTWPMARIVKVYPGKDGHVRAVDVVAQGKVYRRPVHKLVHLLEEEDEASSPRGEYVWATGDKLEIRRQSTSVSGSYDGQDCSTLHQGPVVP